jgi:predicted protein tyrosine phosphatase
MEGDFVPERKIRVLFICTGNRDRSPTAANVFRNHPDLEVSSAGTSPYAATSVSCELLRWADVIAFMEAHHEQYVRDTWADCMAGKETVCLNIADEYSYMHPDLQDLIRHRMMEQCLNKVLSTRNYTEAASAHNSDDRTRGERK